jgi:cytochrome P450
MKKALPVYTTHPFQSITRIMQRVEVEFNKHNAPALRVKVPPYNFVMVRDPDILRAVLTDNVMSLRKNTDDLWRFRWLLPKGGTANPGTADCLARKRKVLKSVAEPALSYYIDCLAPIFDEFISSWNSKTEPFQAKAEAAKLTVKSTFKMFFSEDIPDDVLDSLSYKIAFIHRNLFSRMPVWVPTRNKYQFMKYGTEIRGLFLQYLLERRASGAQIPDMIGHLQHLTNEDGTPYTDQEIIDEICSGYFGGTALIGAVTWSIYWLAAHPDVLQNARKEVDSLPSVKLGASDLQNLPYCRMVAKEIMRLTPPFWSLAPRIATTLEHPEYDIPAGSKMLLSIHHTHRHPDHWQQPDQFYPEHFLPEEEKKRPIYAFMPFGKGGRACIGQHVSLMFLQLFIAMLAARSKIKHLPSKPNNPVPVMGFETLPNEVRVRFTSNA